MTAIVSFFIIVIAVYILAVITDHFFVPSLDEVAKRLDMPSDVAGASLMAVGSSAPELFIALTAVFAADAAHSSVGIGTIVGSAVFNILVITGASAVIVGDLVVKKGSVERDIIFYLGSVALLLFIFRDGEIVLLEAVGLFSAYILYLFILWRWGENNPPEDEDEPQVEAAVVEEEVERKPKQNIFSSINKAITKVFGLIARDPEKQYLWAMIVSIAAIAGISWVLVEAAVAFAAALNLPTVLVSMTLLAAGTSAPDLIASVDVARDGRGSMAVANAVGSDIFDVLVGLGVPWIIGLTILSQGVIEVDTAGLTTSIFLLSATTVLLYIFLYTERRLTRREGWILLLAYVAYVGYAFFTTGSAT
ncbi:MAG: calcium/sodium antiporter [Anaerolineae bacterium]|nr:calcium/sodium antiporter [Anaerolineae bacterium]MDQ7034152.1 calcium/sodium antiporter [Anaerolineae bacterium]